MNKLYYGDNLDILPSLGDDSVDLVYLDPPFNSNRNYNVIFNRQGGMEASAQIEAFGDTWHWTPDTEVEYTTLRQGGLPTNVSDALHALKELLGENDATAYLVNMAPRLVQLHRVLKSTGSLYLHCDPTMSHYLKVLLDAVFRPENFVNEITWKRADTVKGNFGQGAKHFGRNADTILFYGKSPKITFNQQFSEYSDEYLGSTYKYVEESTGRRYSLISMTGPGGAAKGNPYYDVLGVSRYWRYSRQRMDELIAAGMVVQTKPGAVPRRKQYLDEGKGVAVESIWTDIPALSSASSERLGYPTQKPVALLERIISTSSNPGDVVLDPFCGCGTTVDAAQRLGRQWIGIDITYIAIDLILKRLQDSHGDAAVKNIDVNGLPRDIDGAKALFARNPFDFERWAVSLINCEPKAKRQDQQGDKGVDGVGRFILKGPDDIGQVIVSVKGSPTPKPADVRELHGAVERHQAQMGVLLTGREPSRGEREEAEHDGYFEHPATHQKNPKIQVIPVSAIMSRQQMPNLPALILPYIKAQRVAPAMNQASLF